MYNIVDFLILVFIPAAVSQFLTHFTQITAVGRTVFWPVWPLQWPQRVRVNHDAACHALLAHPLPAVPTGPCPATLWALVLPKLSLLKGNDRRSVLNHVSLVWVKLMIKRRIHLYQLIVVHLSDMYNYILLAWQWCNYTYRSNACTLPFYNIGWNVYIVVLRNRSRPTLILITSGGDFETVHHFRFYIILPQVRRALQLRVLCTHTVASLASWRSPSN